MNLSIVHPDEQRQLLEGRLARCPYCKQTKPSLEALEGKLVFFEYMGPGNGELCDKCAWAPVVHQDPEIQARPHVARTWHKHDFTDAKGREFDGFYCGCRGWA
jgi:hypothetical protein